MVCAGQGTSIFWCLQMPRDCRMSLLEPRFDHKAIALIKVASLAPCCWTCNIGQSVPCEQSRSASQSS